MSDKELEMQEPIGPMKGTYVQWADLMDLLPDNNEGNSLYDLIECNLPEGASYDEEVEIDLSIGDRELIAQTLSENSTKFEDLGTY